MMSLQVNVYELMRHHKICHPNRLPAPENAHVEDPFEHVEKKGFTIYGNYGELRWLCHDDGTFRENSPHNPPFVVVACRPMKIPTCFLSYLQLTIVLIMPPEKQ
jgi:hypothetical protein